MSALTRCRRLTLPSRAARRSATALQTRSASAAPVPRERTRRGRRPRPARARGACRRRRRARTGSRRRGSKPWSTTASANSSQPPLMRWMRCRLPLRRSRRRRAFARDDEQERRRQHARDASTEPTTRSTPRRRRAPGRGAGFSWLLSGVVCPREGRRGPGGGGTIDCGRETCVGSCGLLLGDRAHRRDRVDGDPAVLGRVDLDPGGHVVAAHVDRRRVRVGRREPEHDAGREAQLARHERRGHRVLLGVADHARRR